MLRTATARPVQSRLPHLFILLLLLTGCSTPSKNAVVLREGADPGLATRVKDGFLLARVRIGDHEAGPFLIDTGASSLVLDSELAKVVPLSLRGEADVPEVKQVLKVGTLASLEAGPLTLQNTDVTIMDLFAMTPASGEKLAGLLGRPFFAQAVVEIDYAGGSVACFDPKRYRLPRGEWLPLTLRHGRPIVPARLEESIEGFFLLDTGSTATVYFSPQFVRTHPLLGTRQVGKSAHTFFSGTHEAMVAEIAWFELAGHRFEKPRVHVPPPDLDDPLLEGVAGIIGNGFLREFVLVLDYPEAKVAFLPK